METKIWTEYYDWLTWQKKHKHLNLNIDEAVNAYKKEFRLWEESERVRLMNEQLYRLYTEGRTTSAAGGGGESPSGLNSLLSFRFTGTTLTSLYGKSDELDSGWPEVQNRATLTKQGVGSVFNNNNSAIIVGDGAHLAVLGSTNPVLNPFTANRKQTYFWLGVVTNTLYSNNQIFSFFETVNNSKLEVQISDALGLIQFGFGGTYQSGTGGTNISIIDPLGFDPTGATLLIVCQVDLQDVGIFKAVVNTDSTSAVFQQTVTTGGVAQAISPVNIRLGIGYQGTGQQPDNQEVYDFRAYDKILTNAEINTVISELNSTYGTTIIGI